jgi:lysine 2,3-aminomutase
MTQLLSHQKRPVLRTIESLVEAGLLPPDASDTMETLTKQYALAITPDLVDLMDADNPEDPIRKQFVPDLRELTVAADEIDDPIGDEAHEKITGLIHRYENKALLKLVGTCPVYCRFCFRREMVGPVKGDTLTAHEIEAAIASIEATPDLREIIITGGDPLILSLERLHKLASRLGQITHLEKIRWHSRFPVASPNKVTDAMAEALAASGKLTRLALHINHPREFSPAVRTAIATLQKHKIEILSQTVLLAGVNADLGTLQELKNCFTATAMTPYYLHHPDLAKGTGHFRFSLHDGLALIRRWYQKNPDQPMPRYMLDLPGGFGKIDLLSDAVKALDDQTFDITDRHGRVHRYQSVASPLKST